MIRPEISHITSLAVASEALLLVADQAIQLPASFKPDHT
jgi:hypothetical protein